MKFLISSNSLLDIKKAFATPTKCQSIKKKFTHDPYRAFWPELWVGVVNTKAMRDDLENKLCWQFNQDARQRTPP